MYETLAGAPLAASVTADTDARLLRIDRGGLFELLADHTDLLQGLFSMLLRSNRSASPPPLRRDEPGKVISNTVSTP
jgi:CRP-like cAMP-binding protein